MERDKQQKCDTIINEMLKFNDTKIEGMKICIQLEQAAQLKRIAVALEAIYAKDHNRVSHNSRFGF